MSVRFKRSYRDRKQAVAKRKKVIIRTLIIIFVFQILFTVFFTTIRIDTISMEPSLAEGSVMVYSPITYGYKVEPLNWTLPQINTPDRGDLIVFTPPYINEKKGIINYISPFIKFLTFGKIDISLIGSEQWDKQLLIKRIIAVPGDTIRIKNFIVAIKTEDSDFFLSEFEVIDANYDISVGDLPEGWNNSIPFSGNMNDYELEENQYFVLGDNRMQSSDSTSWDTLDRNMIRGKVLLTYWPLNKMKFY